MIEARGLCKRYGRTMAVDDLSFTVAAGQVTGFLGRYGCGRSTTMRWLADADEILRARVEQVHAAVGLSQVAGRRVGAFSPGRRQV